jgi:rhomboid protease GluP
MLNDSPDRNPSETARAPQQVTLRIPSVTPAVTALLLLTMLLLFVVGLFSSNGDPLLVRTGLQADAVLQQNELYRLITPLLLLERPYAPGAIVAVASALLGLYTFYIVGNSMERLWGNLRFALVFFLAGSTSVIVTLLLASFGWIGDDVFFVAAPGAILAVLGAEFIYMVRHRKLYGTRGRQRRFYLAGLAILNLALAVIAPRTEIFGTLGGMIGGDVLSWFVGPLHLPRAHPDEAGALLGEDVNPLSSRWVNVVLYFTVLLSMLTLAVYLGR